MNKELIKKALKTKRFAVVVATTLSFIGGSTGGYLFAKTKLVSKYEQISREEIEQAKQYYQRVNKTGDFADPTVLAEKYDEDEEGPTDSDFDPQTDMVKAAVDILQEQKYVSYNQPPEKRVVETPPVITKNVFDDTSLIAEPDNEFDLDVELDKKAAGLPYIIEKEEYFNNEDDHPQTTLTWYEGDGVLVDARDQPVPNVDGVIGEDNLKFGCGSDDDKVVYVSNPRIGADYEVTLSDGKYTEQVLGFIEHSHKPRLRKFRDDD